MARPKGSFKTPSLRLHKASGQGVVTINGKDFYLGVRGSRACEQKYHGLIGEWLATGRQTFTFDRANEAGLTIAELCVAYLHWAKVFYKTVNANQLRLRLIAIRHLRESYGELPAAEFGPLRLKAIRERLVNTKTSVGRRNSEVRPLSRRYVNKLIFKIMEIFAWGVENEIVPAGVSHALRSVRRLEPGRSDAYEPAPIDAVDPADVVASMPFMSSPIKAMVQLQLVTGMRGGELCIIRTCDIDMTTDPWIYTPQKHKMTHRHRVRKIPLGPKAQEILRPWLRSDLSAYLFAPEFAVREALSRPRLRTRVPHYCTIAAKRKSQRTMAYANRPMFRNTQQRRAWFGEAGTAESYRQYYHYIVELLKNPPPPHMFAKPSKHLNPHYSSDTYWNAVQTAARLAGVQRWHPHQLRHLLAETITAHEGFGITAARAVLGHSSESITQIYAHRARDRQDAAQAAEVMRKIG